MNPFHVHAWATYHTTQVYYLNGTKPHVRLFEVCQLCKTKRQMDFLPEEADEYLTREAR